MAELARIAAAARQPLRIITRPRISPSTSSYLGLSLSHSRNAATALRRKDEKRNIARTDSNDKERMRRLEAGASFLLPLTIVPPPTWRYPSSPSQFAHMIYLLGRNHAMRIMSTVGIYFVSMRTRGLSMPRFRQNKSSSVPAAKTLHAQMSEAVASGDRDTLRKICSSELFQTLAGVIDSRPKTLKTEWELVKYTNKWRYPRLADFRVAYQPLPGTKNMRLIKQAVVSISSVQKLTRYNNGVLVPGSGEEKEMLEHIVLQAEVDTSTWVSEPWKVWGNLSEMPYEQIRDDAIMFAEAMATRSRSQA